MCRSQRVDQRMGHLACLHRAVVRGDERFERTGNPKGDCFDGACCLQQRGTIACQQGRARDHEGVKTKLVHRLFHLVLHAVVQDPGLAVGTHGADHRQAGCTCNTGCARHANYHIEIDGPESLRAAGYLDSRTQCNENIVHRWQREIVERPCNVCHQLGVSWSGARRPTAWTIDQALSASKRARTARPTRPVAPATTATRAAAGASATEVAAISACGLPGGREARRGVTGGLLVVEIIAWLAS